MSISRREFLGASALTAAGLAIPRVAGAEPFIRVAERAPRGEGPFAGRPVVVASDNGIRGVKVAYDRIVAGSDPLDAAIAGVNIQEL
ncbi:MAG TPA: twin-arginine translocation signal domain-containing protein, partial [Gemmatimonadaceae bacterium]|nr:twin-arginine translocation signal domain-containing protein [Gemmatimonadaceae bacterium]